MVPGLAALATVLVAALAGCSDGAAEQVAPGSKVTVAGDSISVGLGAALRDEVNTAVTVKVIGQEGTGLARPDRFDWPARLEELARDFPPEVLVFSVGSNDAQDLRDANGDVVAPMSDGWEDEYRDRLAQAFDAFEGTGTRLVWVGHVRMDDPTGGDTNRLVHEIAADLASSRAWVQVEDLAELTGSGEDEPSLCLLADGVHLSVECYQRAAADLAERVGAA